MLNDFQLHCVIKTEKRRQVKYHGGRMDCTVREKREIECVRQFSIRSRRGSHLAEASAENQRVRTGREEECHCDCILTHTTGESH